MATTKRRITPIAIPMMQPIGGPPPAGMISIEECDRKLEEQRTKANVSSSVPKIGKGEEAYWKKIDDMEDKYKSFGEVDEEEDLIDWDTISEADGDDLFSTPPKRSPSAKRSPPTKFRDYNLAKQRAIESGAQEFTWDNKTYVKGSWANGVPVYKRKDSKKTGCTLHTTRQSCVSDPNGCKFTDKTSKRAAYCSKRSSPSSKTIPMTIPPLAPLHAYDPTTMSGLPVVLANKAQNSKGTLLTLPATTTGGSLQPLSGQPLHKRVKGLYPKSSKVKVKGTFDPNFAPPRLALAGGGGRSRKSKRRSKARRRSRR